MVLMNEMNLDEHLCSVLLEKDKGDTKGKFIYYDKGGWRYWGGSETF